MPLEIQGFKIGLTWVESALKHVEPSEGEVPHRSSQDQCNTPEEIVEANAGENRFSLYCSSIAELVFRQLFCPVLITYLQHLSDQTVVCCQ